MLQPSDPRAQKQRASIIDRLRPAAAGAGIAGAPIGAPGATQPPQVAAAPGAQAGPGSPPGANPAAQSPGANPAVAGLVGRMQPPPAAAQPGPPPDDSGPPDAGEPSPEDEQAAVQRTAPRGTPAKRTAERGEHVVRG